MQSLEFQSAREAISFLSKYRHSNENNDEIDSILERNNKYYFMTDFAIKLQFDRTYYSRNLMTPKDLFHAEVKFPKKEVLIFRRKHTSSQIKQDCLYQRIVAEHVDIFVSGQKISDEEMKELIDENCFYLFSVEPILTFKQIEYDCEIIKSKIVRFNHDEILGYIKEIDLNHRLNCNEINVTKFGIRFLNSQRLDELQSDKHTMLLSEIIYKYSNEKIETRFNICY